MNGFARKKSRYTMVLFVILFMLLIVPIIDSLLGYDEDDVVYNSVDPSAASTFTVENLPEPAPVVTEAPSVTPMEKQAEPEVVQVEPVKLEQVKPAEPVPAPHAEEPTPVATPMPEPVSPPVTEAAPQPEVAPAPKPVTYTVIVDRQLAKVQAEDMCETLQRVHYSCQTHQGDAGWQVTISYDNVQEAQQAIQRLKRDFMMSHASMQAER